MKILVIGSGGREHAIVAKLLQSAKIDTIFCSPGNGGISQIDPKRVQCFDVSATDIDGVVSLSKKLAVDYVFVAPDDPLVLGMVDTLNSNGIKTFGPSKNAAIIEGSKIFSKWLMKKYGIPTADYQEFDNAEKAIEYIKNIQYPTVIKADGLALGKGVIIAENFSQACEAIKLIMEDKLFGDSGNKIIIEEFLEGNEISILCFTDGKTVRPMISSMDHKRALDGDKGLNTGGMGTIAPNPHYLGHEIEAMEKILVPTINALNAENRPFKGCLYFGLMLTKNGLKVIEYNCRFGDPETQVVLPLLKTDLADIIEAVYNGTLQQLEIEWQDECACCVIMASGGYPKRYSGGFEITGLLENGQLDDDSYIFHAGTKKQDGKFLTNGGRVLGVTAFSETLSDAIQKAYDSVLKIDFYNKHYRKDIGKKLD